MRQQELGGQLLGGLKGPGAGFLLLCGLSLAVLAWQFLRSRREDRPAVRTLDKIFGLLATAVLCALAVDAVDRVGGRLGPPLSAASKTTLVGVAAAGALVHIPFAFRRQAVVPLSRRALSGAVLVLSVVACGWSAVRFQATAFPPLPFVDSSEARGALCESMDVIALTDAGNEIRLFHMAGDEPTDTADAGHASEDDIAHTAILRQSRAVRSNCHGWVFCNGSYILPGTDIDRILRENRYSAVDKPQAGDAVIYFDLDGSALHSGLIRGILDDGTVMVESKWGVDRRYLHAVADQPYSQLYTFYRSPRRGHRLTVVKRLPEDLRLSPEDKTAIRSILRPIPKEAGTDNLPSHHAAALSPQG